jgi:hypothetical protein
MWSGEGVSCLRLAMQLSVLSKVPAGTLPNAASLLKVSSMKDLLDGVRAAQIRA